MMGRTLYIFGSVQRLPLLPVFAPLRRASCLLLLLLPLLPACAPKVVQRLPMDRVGRFIHTLATETRQANANWGVLAVNLATGKTLIEFYADHHFAPASNTKLYTSAAALFLLGSDYRYLTPILADGPVTDGVLDGDLIVMGVGDPSWSARMREEDGASVFRGWADSLAARGINRITGDIIGIDGTSDGIPYGAGWMWDDEPFWHGAPISGLMFNENVVDITIVPNLGGTPQLILDPVTDYVTIVNNLTTLDTLNNPDSLVADIELTRPRGSNVARLDGISPPDTVETAVAVENPVLFTATVLGETLLAAGIKVDGQPLARYRFAPGREPLEIVGDTLFTFASPRMGEIVYYLNKDSQNLMAENLLRTVSIGVEGGASAEAGLEKMRPVWAFMGIDTNTIFLRDGSGVSHYNRVTPRATVSLLRFMHGDTTFFKSLPIAGVDGTLEKRMADGPAQGRVFAKTGTLTHAHTLSGYLIQTGGDTVAFSIMINDYLTSGAEVDRYADRLCELLVTL